MTEPSHNAREKQTLGGPAFGWTSGRKANRPPFRWWLSWRRARRQRV